MNHGKINKVIYKGQPNINSEELIKLTSYYSTHRSRNHFQVAITARTAHDLYKKGFTLNEISIVINAKNHSSVHHLLYKYVLSKEAATFVQENYENCIENKLYPTTVRCTEGTITMVQKLLTIDEIKKIADEKRQQAPEPNILPKEWPKF